MVRAGLGRTLDSEAEVEVFILCGYVSEPSTVVLDDLAALNGSLCGIIEANTWEALLVAKTFRCACETLEAGESRLVSLEMIEGG